MHVDGPAFPFIGKAPNGFHDLFSFQNDVRIDQKVPEKFKLLNGQMTGLPVDGNGMFFLIEGHQAIGIDVGFRTLSCRPAQDGADTGNELDDSKGFADVVIGTAVKAFDDIIFAGLGRQHNDRQRLILRRFMQFVEVSTSKSWLRRA